jgi:hypothetical protein
VSLTSSSIIYLPLVTGDKSPSIRFILFPVLIMHLNTLLVASLASLALAAPPQFGPGKPYNTPGRGQPEPTASSTCLTKMATMRGLFNTQTKWQASYTPCTVTSTVTSTTTSTPSQVTTTTIIVETTTSTAETITGSISWESPLLLVAINFKCFLTFYSRNRDDHQY